MMTQGVKRYCEQPILLISESYHNADMYYATGFLAPDKFVYLCQGDNEYLFVKQLEFERAKKESRVKDVRLLEDHGYM
jgi:Xaa-Pro aminopeptidase